MPRISSTLGNRRKQRRGGTKPLSERLCTVLRQLSRVLATTRVTLIDIAESILLVWFLWVLISDHLR